MAVLNAHLPTSIPYHLEAESGVQHLGMRHEVVTGVSETWITFVLA